MYTNCLQCGATTIIPQISLQDNGNYAAPNHQIVVVGNPTAIFKRELMAVDVHAYICGTCGYVALFVESPRRLYDTYQRGQSLLEQQRRKDQKLPRLISIRRITKSIASLCVSLQRFLWAVAQPAHPADAASRRQDRGDFERQFGL